VVRLFVTGCVRLARQAEQDSNGVMSDGECGNERMADFGLVGVCDRPGGNGGAAVAGGSAEVRQPGDVHSLGQRAVSTGG